MECFFKKTPENGIKSVLRETKRHLNLLKVFLLKFSNVK